MTNEEWKDIPGYEGRYQVSDLGRVKSLLRYVNARYGLKLLKGKMLSCSLAADGYSVVRLTTEGIGVSRKVHHLVLEAFVGSRPEGHFGCHQDNDRTNAKLGNLRWDTPKANQVDRVAHGTSNRGERSASCKIDNEQATKVKELLALYGDYHGVNVRISNETGVPATIVSHIKLGETWGHL